MQGDRHHDVMWVFASKWKPGNTNEQATSGSDERSFLKSLACKAENYL